MMRGNKLAGIFDPEAWLRGPTTAMLERELERESRPEPLGGPVKTEMGAEVARHALAPRVARNSLLSHVGGLYSLRGHRPRCDRPWPVKTEMGVSQLRCRL